VWANFMKRATHDDPAEWFARPAGITSVKICRLSGKLATAGCESGDTSTGGPDDRRSLVYTEYFAEGTQPAEYCDQHVSRHLFASIGQLVGDVNPPTVVDQADSGREPVVEGPSSEGDANAARPKGKKGFWSRLFGGGDRK